MPMESRPLSRRTALRGTALGVAAGVAGGRFGALAQEATPMASPVPGAAPSVDEITAIAMDAYIYGYSLVTTEVTRVQMTSANDPSNLTGPMGQFINVPKYPPAGYRGVSAPNADTLYSVAWVDVSEPQVFSHPDMGDRFYLFPMTDLWMIDFASRGTRTGGGAAANYLLTREGWTGEVPAGMTRIPVQTRYMVILGRIYADGTEADYQTVNALQAQLKITPLSAWGTDYTPVALPLTNPGFSLTDKPQKVILDMGTEGYFAKLAELMCDTAPPVPADAPMVERMAQIGIVPCQPFDKSKIPAEAWDKLQSLPEDALAKLQANNAALGVKVGQWIVTKGLGTYGTDYLKRAVVAAFGWPANVQEDAVYPNTGVDSDGKPLNGANRYTLTFAKGQEPPVNGFWSITMYEIDQGWWFVPNALNKFTVSPRNNLTTNADGSTTLLFQHESPGADKEANWLPAPTGDFILMLRMYWPKDTPPSILDGSWAPPAVVKTN